MKCTLQGCPGEYEQRSVSHTVRQTGHLIVIDHVPAKVCTLCGDVLLEPQTIRHIEKMLDQVGQPDKTVPLYEYV